MTSTNIMSLGNVTVQSTDISIGKAKSDISAAFASLLNQPVTQAVRTTSDTKGTETSDAAIAYDKLKNVDNKQLAEARPETLSEKVDAAKEEIEDFEKELVSALSEELEMSEEDVWKALETFGVTVFDLLNPQKLAEVFADFQGMNDQVEVLLSENFENLFVQVKEMGEELLSDLGLSMEDMDALVEELEVVAPEDVAVEVKTDLPEEPNAQVVSESEETMDMPVVEVVDQKEVVKEVAKDTKEIQEVTEEFTEDIASAKPVTVETKEEGARDAKQDPDGSQAFAFHQQTSVESAPVEQAPETFTYADVNAMDIVEQVAENVRVVLSNEETSMSMQLNPENLGKVYINVTTKEGIVNAQITAQNEIVKEALEVQLADLRTNLNQSGIKVNEIEITVATHEFEQNLDQSGREDQRREEEKKPTKRRNLSMETLDDLAGLMTEEEQLAMQIMKDNGNSVDLNA